MRSPPVHCASHKCIGHCADFRALPVAMLPALVRALLRSPPALRASLPRAVRSAPPAAQTPRRLRSAGFPGVDLPIFHTARIDYPTGRAGLGFHTPRIDDAGVPWRSMSCLFGAIRGQTGPCDCWTERMSVRNSRIIIALSLHGPACHAAKLANARSETRAKHERHARVAAGAARLASPVRYRNSCAMRGILGCAAGMRPGCGHSGARRVQSAASRRSDCWKIRASATSVSNSFSRPSRTIASRLSVARNQV